MSLVTAFRHVVVALDAAAIDYVVVGSAAAAAWGVVRSTRDIDLVMVVTEDSAQALVASLVGEDFYVPVNTATEVLARGGAFNVLHPATGGKVDIFVCAASDPFEVQRLARRVRMEVFGVDSWVATPEDVVLSKLRWRLDSQSDVQWRDCVELAAVCALDREHLRTWSDRLGIASDLSALLEQVDGVGGATS